MVGSRAVHDKVRRVPCGASETLTKAAVRMSRNRPLDYWITIAETPRSKSLTALGKKAEDLVHQRRADESGIPTRRRVEKGFDQTPPDWKIEASVEETKVAALHHFSHVELNWRTSKAERQVFGDS